MEDNQRLCSHCMRPMAIGEPVCPHCGGRQDVPQPAPFLDLQTVLEGRYLIGKVLFVQTDSVCYMAQDLHTNQAVWLREFLPQALLTRDYGLDVCVNESDEALYGVCLQEFLQLWRAIGSLDSYTCLPQVRDVFTSGGTAYAVCSPLSAITLETYLQKPDKRLSWDSACRIFHPVMLALGRLHACGLLHGNLSPEALLVGADGKLHVSGFSVAHTKLQIPELQAAIPEGFAPIERYDPRIRLGAYTDVYAMAALMYYAVTLERLPSAQERAENEDLLIPAHAAARLNADALGALTAALQLYPQRRPRTMEAFLEQLGPTEQTSVPRPVQKPAMPVPAAAKPDEKPAEPTSPGMLALKVFLASVLVIILLFCTLYTTVLYRYIDIPFMDRAFASVSFLPMNAETETSATQTTAPTETTLPEVKVVDFKSLTYKDISNNLTFQRNYKLEFEFEASETVPENAVISQSVAAGEMVQQGSVIKIVISSGKPTVALKDVVGMDYDDANELLSADGFRVQKIEQQNDGTHTANQVSAMSLVAGLSFEKGTSVTLTVWDDTPAPTEAPSQDEPTSEAPTEQADDLIP